MDRAQPVPNKQQKSIKVDSDFQFGQQTDGKNRFLVYHNKANKPFQHRFVETTLASGIFNTIKGPLNSVAPLIPYVGTVLKEQFTSRFPGLAGHPLRDWNDAAVTAGDMIVVNDKYEEKDVIGVTWLQKTTEVKTPYVITRFTNLTEGRSTEGILFVEVSKWSELLKKAQADSPGPGKVIKVDSKFQYGQKDGIGNVRFLVYHDAMANPILQKRFLETVAESSKLEQLGTTLGSVTNHKPANKASLLSGLTGDALKNF
ncbi:hypothetical protein CF319_g6690 [Tilletia indica]|nr:hypothetical protein CF319_g6690 [Tilletia indica]